MKNTILFLITLFFLSESYGAMIIERFPTLSYQDAMGTSIISIKNFCLTEDEAILKGRVPFCLKAKDVGHNEKVCINKDKQKLISIKNSFSRTIFGPRGRRTRTHYSYGRYVKVKVVNFDPRGHEEVIETYDYKLNFCQ